MEEKNHLITFEHHLGNEMVFIFHTIFCAANDVNSIAEEMRDHMGCILEGFVNYIDAKELL